MKTFFTFLFILGFSCFYAQNSHPTIDTVEVSYMTVSGGMSNVLPEPIIHLKTLSGVSKVHCKIINPSDSSVVYNVFYTISASPVFNSNGQPLFVLDNLNAQILGPDPIELKDYTYQVQTEDDQGNLTTPYIYQRIVQ
ncbi:MAG: hypothetical protein JST26_07990 [Bacteroidetes bacterium]|nr:hypothetical protein [Bacteroidota bacterium]